MNFDEFTGEIQHRLELPGTGETVRAIRATLMTLGQRIPEDNAEDFAASLPLEIKWYPTGAVHEHGQRFDWKEFVTRVSEIEGNDRSEAAHHAQVIMDLASTLVPPSDLQQLRDSTPGKGGRRELAQALRDRRRPRVRCRELAGSISGDSTMKAGFPFAGSAYRTMETRTGERRMTVSATLPKGTGESSSRP